VWSLGVILYSLTCGKLPFSGADNSEIANNIIDGVYRVPSFCSKSLCNLISSMLRVEPLHRINMKEIRAHPWVVAISSPTPAPRKFNRISSEDNVDEPGNALQRENKKSVIGAFFNKLINRKSSTNSKEQKKTPTSKIDRREKRKSVMITSVPVSQPSRNKRWSISLGKLKLAQAEEVTV